MPETGYKDVHGQDFNGGYTAEVHIIAGSAVWPANFIHAKDQDAWTPDEAKLPGGVSNASASLDSVACPSASACVAVGSYSTASADQVPLLLTGSGSSWTSATAKLPGAADPNGQAFVNLYSVACGSASRCVAAGSYNGSSGGLQGLLVSGSGSSWTAVTVPEPAGTDTGEVFDVACLSASKCVAIGDYLDASGHSHGLLMTGYGSSWTAATPPLPGGAARTPNVSLNAITCPSASLCVVGGSYTDSSGHEQGLLLGGSSNTWYPVRAPLPAGSAANPGAEVDAVTCTSPVLCVAAGDYTDSAGHQQGLLLTGIHFSWSPAKAELPGGAAANPGVGLDTLACPSTGKCVAGGTYQSSSGNQRALLLTGYGASWMPATLDQAPIYQEIGDMACTSSTQCVIPGYYLSGSDSQGLMVAGSGSSWTTASVPAPANAASADTNQFAVSVACPSATECVAVGSYIDSSYSEQGLLLTARY
jgi:hypothetical protein